MTTPSIQPQETSALFGTEPPEVGGCYDVSNDTEGQYGACLLFFRALLFDFGVGWIIHRWTATRVGSWHVA